MLDAITHWALDAAQETTDAWDLPAQVIERGKADKLCLVTGARGGGKTTFARQLAARVSRKRIVKSIAITGEALALMRHVDPSSGGAKGVASYLIHLAALEALVQDGVITRSDVTKAAPAFVPAFSPHLARLASLLFDAEFLSTLFTGAQPPEAQRRTPGEQASAIADMLAPYMKRRPVHLLFDETRSKAASSREFDAVKADGVTALLQAGLPESGQQRSRHQAVMVTVLCGPELAGGLPQDVTSRIGEHRYDLEWDEAAMRLLAGFRVDRTERTKAKPDNTRAAAALAAMFETASERVAGSEYGRVGPWPYIWRRSRARPRDVVHLLRAIAQAAEERGVSHITEEVLEDAEHVHSDYMRSAIIDELQPVCPEIGDVMAGLSQLKARHGEAELLASVIQRSLERDSGVADAAFGSHEIIHMLFKASAIGNLNALEGEIYRCLDPRAELNWGDPVVVHPALATSLELVEEEDAVQAA